MLMTVMVNEFCMIPMIFFYQYCNVYVPTPNIRRLLDDVTLQSNCLEYVAITGITVNEYIIYVFAILLCLIRVHSQIERRVSVVL